VNGLEKGEVVKAYKEYEQYLSALAASCRSVEDVHAPIAEGKWSVAEIVMHLAEWDRYIREQRLPGMMENARLEGAPDVGRFNEAAAAKAVSMEFEEVVSYAQRERALLRKAVEAFSPKEWKARFYIGERATTAEDYLGSLLGHDIHHRQQIDDFLP
jgi:uncharacterized damage-inducible protein DinB